MKQVPKKTVERALLYIRTLENLIKNKRYLISSRELSALTGLSDVQIRKDISSFGKVGTPRIGYKTVELKRILEGFILQQNIVHVALFGTGNLGSAILKYPGFHKGNIKLVAAFDKDPSKIGRKINGISIHAIEQAPAVIKKTHADIGILAVPAESSQEVADVMILSGLKGIVNFAPATINAPVTVKVKDIDLSIEFLSLFCDAVTKG